jgi:hypothetical protein
MSSWLALTPGMLDRHALERKQAPRRRGRAVEIYRTGRFDNRKSAEPDVVYAPAMWRVAVLLLGMIGCASTPPGPVFRDDNYLRFGVDPNTEANAVIESQKERDYRLAQRLVGRHFTALGFMDKGGRSRAVRILTMRGIGVALDSRPQSPIEPATTYALVAPPIKDTHDADQDGFEEVFVEEQTQGSACLRVFRVRDVGSIDPVVVESQVLGQEICPNAAIDLDGDGIIELSTELELVGFPSAGGSVPNLLLPLWADKHRFVARPGPGPQRAWVAQQRASREVELQRARVRLDVASCYVLGIELAALAYLERSDPATQLAAFDRALHGLVLTQAQAAASASARARIFTDWNDPTRISAPRAIARLPAKEMRAPTIRELNASKTAPANDPRSPQPALRLSPAPRPQHVAPLPTPAQLEEPVLAEGEFVITPQSAAAEDAKRRGARARTDVGPSIAQAAAQLPAADEVNAYRAAARELGNAAVAERRLAATARQAAAAERREAHAARLRAFQAADVTAAAEQRAIVAEHTAAAQRYAAEAAEHAATAAMHRAALAEHKARVQGVDGYPAAVDPGP